LIFQYHPFLKICIPSKVFNWPYHNAALKLDLDARMGLSLKEDQIIISRLTGKDAFRKRQTADKDCRLDKSFIAITRC